MPYNLDVKKLTADDWQLNNCKERSLYILQKYSKTEKELRDKLRRGKKSYSDEVIDKTIEFLKAHHFIDDIAYTKRYIELHKNSYSKKVIKQKLFLKGIKKTLLDEIIESSDISFDEESIIKKLLLKKCPDYFDNPSMDIKEKQKLLSFLFRKGFSYDKIKDVMKCEEY